MNTTELKQTTTLAGQYKATITHADGSVTETPWMDNLILNSGLDDLGGLNSPDSMVASHCHVGTGTTTPAATQLALDAKIASKAVDTMTRVSLGSPTYKAELTYNYTFEQGAVVGNISEVGVGALIAGTRLFSRALFTTLGVPVAITVVALDQLTISYKLTVAPPLTDSTGSVVIAGVTYGYTGRLASAASFMSNPGYMFANGFSNVAYAVALNSTATLGTVVDSGTGGFASTYSVIATPYTAGSYSRTTTVVYDSMRGNDAGGIKGFHVSIGGMMHNYQYVLDTAIPKTNTNELRINFTTSWARV